MMPGAALLVALLFQISAAAAPEPATKLRLMVHAAAACTSRNELAARIAARSARIEVVDDAPLTAEVAVWSPRPGSVVADLVLARPGVEPTPRKVTARSCAEVADGVALIIAVTLDPSLRRRPASGLADEPEPPPAGASSPAEGPPLAAPPRGREPSAGAASPAGGPVPPRSSPVAAPPAPPAVTPPPAPSAPAARPARVLGALLAGQAISGPAPAVMPGLAVYATAALERDGAWAPAVVIGFAHLWRSDLTEPGGAASFTLDAASLDACPLRLRWSGLEARPCAAVLLGRLASEGSSTPKGASAARPFGAAGAALIASFGSTIEVGARLAAGVTLLRDSYTFTNAAFFRAEALTLSASLGVGFRWP